MYQKINPLTQEEQNFAVVHYDIVFSFLRSRGLDAEEYHGIVIERYLRAVHQYLTKPQLRQYSFYTVAKWAMLSALSNYWRKLRYEQQHRSCVPLDILADSEEGWECGCLEQQSEARDTLSRIGSRITPKQKKTIALISAGYPYKEIGQAEGITESGVRSRIYRIRRNPDVQWAKAV